MDRHRGSACCSDAKRKIMWSLPPAPTQNLKQHRDGRGNTMGPAGPGSQVCVSHATRPLVGASHGRTRGSTGPRLAPLVERVPGAPALKRPGWIRRACGTPDPMLLRSPNGGTRSHFARALLSPHPHTDVRPPRWLSPGRREHRTHRLSCAGEPWAMPPANYRRRRGRCDRVLDLGRTAA